MAPVRMLGGHKTWAPGRKSDPAHSMDWRRTRVAAVLAGTTPTPQEDDMYTDADRARDNYVTKQLKSLAELEILLTGRVQAQIGALAQAVGADISTETAEIDAQLAEIKALLNDASSPPIPAGPVPILAPASSTLSAVRERAIDQAATSWYLNALDALWSAGLAHGVDPVVLAAQCGKETGWGRFDAPGAVLDESYNNTCGLKITRPTGDRPEDHARFPNLPTAARAHVDHLGAYAGKAAPADTPDPRYVWVAPGTEHFGTAQTVEELGGKWAPDLDYGVKIEGLVRRLRGQ